MSAIASQQFLGRAVHVLTMSRRRYCCSTTGRSSLSPVAASFSTTVSSSILSVPSSSSSSSSYPRGPTILHHRNNNPCQKVFHLKTTLSSPSSFSSSSSFSNNNDIIRMGTEDPRMSKVVIHGGIIYLSGQTDTTGTDITEQTKNVLTKIDTFLEQAGSSKSNLLTATIWLKDIDTDFVGMNTVWNEWLDPDNKPVRATVQALMARPSILVEIQVTAAV